MSNWRRTIWIPPLVAAAASYPVPMLWLRMRDKPHDWDVVDLYLGLLVTLTVLAGWLARRGGLRGRWGPALAGLAVPIGPFALLAVLRIVLLILDSGRTTSLEVWPFAFAIAIQTPVALALGWLGGQVATIGERHNAS